MSRVRKVSSLLDGGEKPGFPYAFHGHCRGEQTHYWVVGWKLWLPIWPFLILPSQGVETPCYNSWGWISGLYWLNDKETRGFVFFFFFPMVFGWRVECLSTKSFFFFFFSFRSFLFFSSFLFYRYAAPFLVFWLVKADFGEMFCHYSLVFPGFQLLYLQVWEIESKNKIQYNDFPWILSWSASLSPSFIYIYGYIYIQD